MGCDVTCFTSCSVLMSSSLARHGAAPGIRMPLCLILEQ